jgi:NADPH-dependent 2,4-dienoyl-CoA reductase/sulfur reductase-like enzyme
MTNESFRFEVVVVGAGPAGLAAACAAAECGRRTAVLDATPWLGGQIWRGQETKSDSGSAKRWLARLHAAGVVVVRQTAVIAALRTGVLLAESPEGSREFGWEKLILTIGARELFLPFPGWTLPGVVGIGGLQVLVKAGWPLAGKKVVLAGSGPLLFAAAAEYRAAGADIVMIAEQTNWAKLIRFGLTLPRLAPGKLFQAAKYKTVLLRVPYRPGCWVTSAQGVDGLESVTLRSARKTWTERCDYLATGFGLLPSLELPRLLGCRLEDGAATVNDRQESSQAGVYIAGEPTGIGGEGRALVEGLIAGFAAAGRPERAERLFRRRRRTWAFSRAMDQAFALRDEVKNLADPETLICRCEDVTRRELEKYGDWRSAKLQTRCGMGPCQGRICGAAVEKLFGWKNESIRPPVFPVQIETLREAGSAPRNGSEKIRSDGLSKT